MKAEENDNVQTETAAMTAQVFTLARQVPAGRVLSYGALGARCEPPISGYVCGRIMNNVGDDVPWWRIVAKDGSLPIAKRNPNLALRQRELLEQEGVKFDADNRVLESYFETDAKPQSDENDSLFA